MYTINVTTFLAICLFNTHPITCWSGILITSGDGTQLYFPTTLPHSVGDVNFSIPQYWGGKALALPNKMVLFIGGYNRTANIMHDVNIFNPMTNTTTKGVPMHYARYQFAASVLHDMVVVCGGQGQTVRIASLFYFVSSSTTL
jgi:hypothetical protein